MKFRNVLKIGLVLAVFVLLCSSASWADWNEVFYDDFDDGEYDGWTVTNWKGETRQAPDVVPSPEGYSLRGVGSGYSTPPPVDAWISHPVSISDVTELKIEMRAKSGPQWPNRAAVYLVSSSDCYVFDDYGEAGENETADLQFYINGLWDFLLRYPIGSRAFEWHTFAWTRDANGWWSLSIDGQVEAANFGQDNRLTSFDRVGIMVMRNQSEIEWVRISFITEPPEPETPAEQIQEILDFIDTSVNDGTLAGVGPGKSADKRPNALINMLETAQWLIETEATAWACQQLLDAYKFTDGQSPPPDKVTGAASSELAERILNLIESITSGAVIVTVDGLSFANTLVPGSIQFDETEHYLRNALQGMDLSLVPDVDIESFTWSRDAGFPPSASGGTSEAVGNLRGFLRQQYNEKGENKKFIVVAHSWGTFLSYCALSDLSQDADPVRCDLWITLSSPLGTRYAHEGILYLEESLVDDFVVEWLSELSQDLDNNPLTDNHANFWAWGDVISGPWNPFLGSGADIDENLDSYSADSGNWFEGWAERNAGTTSDWHLFTALEPVHPDDGSLNESLRDDVQALIIQTLTD